MVLRISDPVRAYHIVDPRVSWSVEANAMFVVDLGWDVFPQEAGSVPLLFPGKRVSLASVRPVANGWEVVEHVVNGSYVVEKVSVSREMRHLSFDITLRRFLL